MCCHTRRVSIPFETQLQYLNYEPPYVAFHSWDALNPRPTTVFSRQAYQNGLFIFPALTSLIPVEPELENEDKGALLTKVQSKKQSQADTMKKVQEDQVPHLFLKRREEQVHPLRKC